jgi:lipoprotein-releasing system permease protein
MISVLGMFVSTSAMIIVLSGFNGIEQLVKNLYSDFNADLVIAPKEGKSFAIETVNLEQLKKIDGVLAVYDVIEEITMLKKEDNYVFASMKGVGPDFFNTDLVESKIVEGQSVLPNNEPQAIIGEGIQARLKIYSTMDFENTFTVYGLSRNKKLSTTNQGAFTPKSMAATGIFRINPDYDSKYFLVPLDFANQLLDYDNHRSAIEISIKEGFSDEEIKIQVMEILGDRFTVKTRYEQNEMIFKTNETEKWMVFIILGFIMIISTFNIIASLTMLIIDKTKDINTMLSFGATPTLIRQIFFLEGLLINFIGGLVGIAVGLLICWIQIQFKVITMQNSIVDHWPVIIQWKDVGLVFLTVFSVGVISSYLPVSYLIRKHFMK